MSLDEKLKSVLPFAHALRSPAGTKQWEQYKILKQIRDRLVHLKSLDRKSSGPEHQTVWGLMISKREMNFVSTAYAVIGTFRPLVKDRRWYKIAGEMLQAK